jgi:hypothetical protein
MCTSISEYILSLVFKFLHKNVRQVSHCTSSYLLHESDHTCIQYNTTCLISCVVLDNEKGRENTRIAHFINWPCKLKDSWYTNEIMVTYVGLGRWGPVRATNLYNYVSTTHPNHTYLPVPCTATTYIHDEPPLSWMYPSHGPWGRASGAAALGPLAARAPCMAECIHIRIVLFHARSHKNLSICDACIRCLLWLHTCPYPYASCVNFCTLTWFGIKATVYIHVFLNKAGEKRGILLPSISMLLC